MTETANSLRRGQLQDRLGYRFSDAEKLALALTHRSAGKTNNERLEFLGDSLINHIVAEELYQRYPDATEGQLSRMRAKLVRGTFLAQLAQSLALGEALVLGTGERKSGGRHRESILADVTEAVAGAILLDGGFERARTVVRAWFGNHFDGLMNADGRDAKTRLQEWLQGRGEPRPVYELVQVSGADHEQVFEVSCRVERLPAAVVGRGRSRRAAEQLAAKSVLLELTDDG